MVRVEAELLPGGKRVVVELETGRVLELLRKLGMGSEDAVVVRDGVPLLAEDVLLDGERVRVFQAASGG